MAAALMTMTQCRKQETVPATPSADTIKMTITAGPGAKTDITNEGAITWTSDDKLYVSDGAKWLGSLTLQSGVSSASGTFTGTIASIGEGTTTCHFFYLGHDNGMAAPTANTTTDVSISFASQDGTRGGALKYHLGHGSADVTVSGGVATGAVAMRTEIAIAHLKLTMDSKPYTGSATMDVSNTMTVSPAGTFSGSDNGINIGDNGGSGDRYVTLIPTTGTESVDVSFSGSATGSMTFGHGIQANNLYGMENGIEVTVTKPLPYLPGEFSVSESTKVKFSKGNLYYDGTTDNKWKFEANQYDFRTYNGKGSCINGTYNSSSGTPTNDWGLFGWSGSNQTHYGMSTSTSNADYSGSTLNDWGNITDLPSAGESKTWRTLSSDEWGYLMGTRPASTINGVDDARYAEVKVNGVCGMMLFPDTFTWPTGVTSIPSTFNTNSKKWNGVNYNTADFRKLESAGVVFLPVAGYRSNKGVQNLGINGYYWSSTSNDSRFANYLDFNTGSVNPTSSNQRYNGFSVRLVR